jgi:hypothetical protein
LRVLQFPANPYPDEFEGETELPMATENPDIVVKNPIRVLVECKSRNEWDNVAKYDKRVGGAFYMYQGYAEEGTSKLPFLWGRRCPLLERSSLPYTQED